MAKPVKADDEACEAVICDQDASLSHTMSAYGIAKSTITPFKP
jgi:hypothetical protein